MAHSAKAGRSVPPEILNVLQLIRAGRAQTVPEIAGLTGLSEPDVDRWVRRLTDWRLLEAAESDSYRAGLVLRLTDGGTPPSASGFLSELARLTDDGVRLGVLHGSGVAFVEQRVATARPAAAGTRPAETTAMGHALLAFRSERGAVSPIAERYLADPEASGHPVRALAVTRLSGVAITRRGARRGGYRVAVPVLGSAGTAVVAIELSTPNLGVGFPAQLEALLAASRSAARRLALMDHDGASDSAAPACSP